ncbi:hypothetical protein B0T19DRAFT_401550 [Cercophora scortea]|uniref:Rho-GAP domain-containing protein n=1 Tax=Cercophora scortea TaxID=314031 RepID=A0AAE0M9T6_9PEZI|nr:hypothetical protein B0T19DRAFT_401550 [Cercophora scortea]
MSDAADHDRHADEPALQQKLAELRRLLLGAAIHHNLPLGGGLDHIDDGGYYSRDGLYALDDDQLDAETRLGHKKNYMRALMEYADGDDMMAPANDDIDADTDESDDGDQQGYPERSDSKRRRSSQRRSAAGTTATTATSNLPSVDDSIHVSPSSKFASRISRVPFDNLLQDTGSVPDLVSDHHEHEQEGHGELSPAVPSTPHANPVDDVFQSLAFAASPELQLAPFAGFKENPTITNGDDDDELPVKSASRPSDPVLNMIKEEGETARVDHAPQTRPSLDRPERRNTIKKHRYEASLASTAQTMESAPSIRSLATTTSSEPEPPNTKTSPPRPMARLFSRLRNSVRSRRAIPEEDFIEKRSLTPFELSPAAQQRIAAEGAMSGSPPNAAPGSSGTVTSEPHNGMHFGRRPSSSSQSTSTLQNKKQKKENENNNNNNPKAGAFFGVDLKQSINVAPMRIRISHKGRSTSYRTFPLGVYKCCEFIRSSGCTDANLFSSADAYNVSQLKQIFNTGPSYGESFTFASNPDYTVYDAARLILIFLSELPKPLVSNSVLKSWIMLARQEGAIEPPCPQRLDTGLDFWAEALNRLPMANRSLVKHLLNLFAEILISRAAPSHGSGSGSGSGDAINEADARRLAASVARALFHTDEGKFGGRKTAAVHPTLALAFLIVKRGEYMGSLGKVDMVMGGAGRRESNMFLPSTKEMMRWKGQS